MTARNITRTDQASSCYFRTTADGGTRKALVQIDERCNLHCAHCFVSATKAGESMPYDDITGLLIPRLKACRVERVTLTGGEPTIHPRFTGIVQALRGAGMQVGFCTNATTLTDAQISELAGIGGVHANVSLDGFRAESHGRFRGDRDSFAVTVATVRKLAAAGLLQGLLCTPNSLAEDEEYRELCQFAAGNGASYVLMNPLSSMGRGVKSRGKLSSGEEHMRRIRALTAPFDSRKVVEVGGKLFLEAPKGRRRRKRRSTIYPVRTPAGYPLAEQIAARAEQADRSPGSLPAR
jgi:MoaA/NifB/PqqE/SkfB family radical SAM enzyme